MMRSKDLGSREISLLPIIFLTGSDFQLGKIGFQELANLLNLFEKTNFNSSVGILKYFEFLFAYLGIVGRDDSNFGFLNTSVDQLTNMLIGDHRLALLHQ